MLENDGTYKTKAGDTWSLVSYRIYRSSRYMPQLIESNLEHRWTSIFASGVVLQVPEIQLPRYEDLPPWRAV